MAIRIKEINLTLDRPVYRAIEKLARRDGTSLPLKVRDLLYWSLEHLEDIILTGVAKERDKTFNHKKSLSHHQIFGR